MDNLTSVSTLPNSVVRWARCLMLHKKIPVFTGEYEIVNGEKCEKLKWICKECQNDNDPSQNPRPSETT